MNDNENKKSGLGSSIIAGLIIIAVLAIGLYHRRHKIAVLVDGLQHDTLTTVIILIIACIAAVGIVALKSKIHRAIWNKKNNK